MKFPSVPVTQKLAGEEERSASRGSDSLKIHGNQFLVPAFFQKTYSPKKQNAHKVNLIHNAAVETSKT